MLRVAGTDEVGRGPLAGPVVAAAVILDDTRPIEGLKDSKKLSEKKRDILFDIIQERALSFAWVMISPQEVDRINVLQASLLAMKQSIEQLHIQPTHVLVDGNQPIDVSMSSETIIKGDDHIPQIQAASILAKVVRDRYMTALDAQYPGYGFKQHKGYPTKAHLQALRQLGICPEHRRSYAPVREILACL